MGLLSRKNEPKVEEVAPREEMSQEEIQIIKNVLLGTQAAQTYLLCKDGEKLYNIASKL